MRIEKTGSTQARLGRSRERRRRVAPPAVPGAFASSTKTACAAPSAGTFEKEMTDALSLA